MKAVNLNLRRSVAIAAVVLTLPALASCSSNFDVPTNRVYNPGEGVNNRDGSVDVLHALIVSDSDGSGTVVAALVNNDEANDDTLVGVAGAGDDESIAVQTDGEIPVGAGALYQLADEGDVSVTGDQIQAGRFVSLLFSFERGESVTIEVPVVDRTGPFADVPMPSESTSPTAESPSESASPSPSPSASPSAASE